MQLGEQLDSGTIERLERQGDLLLRMYQTELAKNPTSRATESSRSNMIAVRHTIEQIYGRIAELGTLEGSAPSADCGRTGGDENASVSAARL